MRKHTDPRIFTEKTIHFHQKHEISRIFDGNVSFFSESTWICALSNLVLPLDTPVGRHSVSQGRFRTRMHDLDASERELTRFGNIYFSSKNYDFFGFSENPRIRAHPGQLEVWPSGGFGGAGGAREAPASVRGAP